MPIYQASRHVNAPLEKLARNRQLPLWGIDDPDTWVPSSAALMLATDVREIVGPQVFGIWMEQAAGLPALGPLGDLLLRSRTLGDALRRYIRFYPQFRTFARLSAVQHEGDLWIRRSVDLGSLGSSEVLQIYAMSEIIKIVGLAAGNQWTPKKIVLGSNEEAVLQTMPHLAGANALIGADFSAIAIPTSLLSLPMPRPQASVVGETTSNAPGWSLPPACFTDCVSEVISAHFIDGYPDIDLVAECIDLNARTVQRRLAADGTTFRELVERYRFDAAKRLLKQREFSSVDVAMQLGYTDASSFSRAFRRWTSVSPRQYRASRTVH